MATSRITSVIGALAAATLLTAASARADGFNAGTETIASGAVSATLSWDRGEFGPQNTTLTISRAGVVVFGHTIARVCGPECQRSPGDGSEFELVDLDGDGEPEVVVMGRNLDPCCETLGVYDFRPASGTYGELARDSQSSVKVQTSGGPHIVTTDSRLEPLLGSVFLPVQVLRYERPGGVPRLRDATRAYPKLIRADAAEQKGLFKGLERKDFSAPHVLGAYVADEYLLGRGAAALRELDKQLARGVVGSPKESKTYRRKLLTLLHRTGYR
jgi:hypothetical protein